MNEQRSGRARDFRKGKGWLPAGVFLVGLLWFSAGRWCGHRGAGEPPGGTPGAAALGRTPAEAGVVPRAPQPRYLGAPPPAGHSTGEGRWAVEEVIAEFSRFEQKALKTVAQKGAFRALLGDRGAVLAVKQALQDGGERGFSLEQEKERLRMVSFFRAALAWEDNPERLLVIDSMKEVIESDNHHRYPGNPRLQRSLVGDKEELLMALWKKAPDEASALIERGLTGKNRAFFLYILGIRDKG